MNPELVTTSFKKLSKDRIKYLSEMVIETMKELKKKDLLEGQDRDVEAIHIVRDRYTLDAEEDIWVCYLVGCLRTMQRYKPRFENWEI